MLKKLFIAGTDTGVGKTWVTAALLQGLAQRQLNVFGIKPLATGGKPHSMQLVNGDALMLMQSASVKLEYEQVNPLIFEPAIAPHIAAQLENQPLSGADLYSRCQFALHYPADICLIEGVGGWLTPLNEHETMADFAKLTASQVILVVGMRLGCLNHALLTAAAIEQAKVPFFGWIANCIDPHMAYLEQNISTLQRRIKAPCLGVVPYDFPHSEAADLLVTNLQQQMA